MFNYIKKYFNFIFKTELNQNKSYRSYEYDIDVTTGCRNDPLEFIRQYFPKDDILFKSILNLDREQLYILDTYINKSKIIVKTPNYSTVTQVQTIIVAWLLLFYPEFNIYVLTPNQDMARNFIKDVLHIMRCMKPLYIPEYEKVNQNLIELKNKSRCVAKAVPRSNSANLDYLFVDDRSNIDLVIINECTRISRIRDLFPLIDQFNAIENIFLTDLFQNLDKDTENVKWFNDLYNTENEFRNLMIKIK